MPNMNRSKRTLPKMTAKAKVRYECAVAEEMAAKDDNVAATRPLAKRLKAERKTIAELVAQLRKAREKAGVSLKDMEVRTGISKSSLSRLENSAAPNPTMLTLHRYAAAIGAAIEHRIVDDSSSAEGDSAGNVSRHAAPTSRTER